MKRYLPAVFAASFFFFAPALYLLPTYEAWKRDHRNLTALGALNLFLGWTLVGWVGALVWALSRGTDRIQEQSSDSSSVELERLAKLRDSGVLTEEEFFQQKQKVLSR